MFWPGNNVADYSNILQVGKRNFTGIFSIWAEYDMIITFYCQYKSAVIDTKIVINHICELCLTITLTLDFQGEILK